MEIWGTPSPWTDAQIQELISRGSVTSGGGSMVVVPITFTAVKVMFYKIFKQRDVSFKFDNKAAFTGLRLEK